MNKREDGIIYIGASDTAIDLFENQYPVPEGMAYNSYVIDDEKIAVIDTVDARVSDKWRARLKEALGGRKPSYLVVQHLEPDHSANIGWFANEYPDAEIVISSRGATMLPQFFRETTFKIKAVKEGDTLSLGKHSLTFIMAPMVHWPEVMVSYDSAAKALFSADAFGEFGATTDDGEDDDEWATGAKRYYYNICGKYGVQVTGLLKKAAALDIKTIYALHGPILSGDNAAEAIAHYKNWGSYTPESEGVLIAYASIHGNTETVAKKAAQMLEAKGQKTMLMDLTRTDVSYAVAEAFDHPKVPLAASSYDAGLFPPMENLLLHLKSKNFNGRTLGLIENGSWAPTAAKEMLKIIETMKNITVLEPVVTVKTTLDDASKGKLEELVSQIASA